MLSPRAARSVVDGSIGAEGSHARPRDGEARHRAEEREQQTLGEQKSDEPRTAGADGDPHGHFAASRARASEQQVRHVDARDEQHQSDGAEQDEERSLDRGRQPRVVQRRRLGAPRHLAELVGNGLAHSQTERGRRSRRLGLGHAGRAAPDEPEPMVLWLGQLVRGLGGHRHEHVRLAGQPAEIARPDADDGPHLSVDVDRTSDDRRIRVVAPLPERVRDDRLVRRAGVRVDRPVEIAAARRREPEHAQIARADVLGGNALDVAARQRDLHVAVDRQVAEYVLGVAEHGVLGVGPDHSVPLRFVASRGNDERELHQLVRPSVRKRAEEQNVHGAVDRRRRADADREREHRDRRERRASNQTARRVVKVLHDALEKLGESHAALPIFGGGVELVSRVVERRAESANRLDASVVGRLPARDEVLDAVGDERVELVIDVAPSGVARRR